MKCHATPTAVRIEGGYFYPCYFTNDTYYCWIAAEDNMTVSFITKIPGGRYNKLYIDMSSEQRRENWNMCNLQLSTSGILTGYYSGNFQGYFKGYTLVNRRVTAEDINSQEGIIINSSSSARLDRQTVIVDISGISDDFYVGFHVCQNNTYIYNMYVDV
jgi:hypothetical protein